MTTSTSSANLPQPGNRPNGKILVVDDDRNLVELIKTRLLAADYGVEAVFDDEQARAQLQDDSFDLAIVDLRLTNSNGLTLMEELHELRPEMPVIILTGYGSIENAVDAMKKGAYSYLTKPFDARELLLHNTVLCPKNRVRYTTFGFIKASSSPEHDNISANARQFVEVAISE